MELEHFSHGHPLLLSDHQEQKDDDGGEEIACAGCLLPLSSGGGGPTYNCIQCKYFLHKSCAELPHKILQFLHPRHPLTLASSESERGYCDDCEEEILGFAYQCPNSLCDFSLHIKCASLLDIVQAEGHKHSFMLLKPMKIKYEWRSTRACECDACGQGIEGISYLCTTCQYLVHECCITITKTIKQIGHPHQLHLSYFAPGNQSCNICISEIQETFLFYSCSICTYTAHLSCVTLEDPSDDAFLLKDENQEPTPFDLIPNHNETNIDSTITQDVSTNNLEENQITAELEHFSHPHVLVHGKNDLECDKKYCDGCVWPIFDLPFYSCSQCNFHLHKACAELPHKISHLLHPHQLTLRLHEPNEVNIHGTFECNVCETICNGFAYSCDMCNFSIDVRCSLLTATTLEHKSHQHTLRFFRPDLKNVMGPLYCKACPKQRMNTFICIECLFYIDLRCVTLPYTTKHRCPKHNWEFYPFHLTFGTEKGTDDSDTFSVILSHQGTTFYCDVCEEKRDKRHWFYYCEDCDYSAHPSCVLRNSLNKFK